jgi:DNA-binding transcriptional regulator YiaG
LNHRLDGTTSEAFARRVDVTLRTVQRWRSGETQPNGADLLRVARELNCNPADLYPADEDAA